MPVLIFLPRLDELDPTNAVEMLKLKRDLAVKLNVPLVDVTPDIRPEGKALYLDADPVHFNGAGNAMAARRLFESLTNHLAR